MIRVLIVDDHPIVRTGLGGLVDAAPDLQVVGTAATGEDAVAAVEAAPPDVVLMDLRMPGMDGDEATGRILAVAPEVRVVILTTYETDDAILRAIGAGASGYLLKAAPEDELLAGIRAVAAGEVALAPSVARVLVRQASHPRPPAPVLTPREREVLSLVAAGLSNRAIGSRLHVGEATVKTHLLHVFAKLEVDDRTRAVTRAMELGLLGR
ncbi:MULTISPECIES: response regulator [Microbacterium]|uniref:Response regulator transcription factor n=1 Tax=Microbacterium wangchenii TaxID=2541726 RepID=A0ABX5SYQ6_9MICO|nr:MULTISPECIES: response regulator transcription factor [Microbacterium]MCK6065923.1 response regulator transcription factor [Microbacterium sp. EYE_512]QBR90223.1 response regulator transcription factor [Microbacterium wangchenii]TXK11762.1 response regulator transcription factor [Microbacterium wangchenii]